MKKIILTMLFAVFMLSALSVPSYSQTIGISEGDWFVYEGSFTTDPETGSAAPQIDFYNGWAGYESLNRTVTNVTGTVITFEDVYTLTGGGTTNETTVLNISAPTTNQYWAIDADAVVGSAITLDDQWLLDNLGNGTAVVTGTMEWGFPTPRDCLTHETTTTTAATVDRAFWWDDATGILIQAWLKSANTDGSNTEWKMLLVETSEWDIPEFPTGTAMLLVFVAITVSIDIYRRKKLKL